MVERWTVLWVLTAVDQWEILKVVQRGCVTVALLAVVRSAFVKVRQVVDMTAGPRES